ncbi:thioredoxin domain-containing protein [Calidifontibacter sp. DB0510]|uniref:Thioredoxin domain-containing protein n=1 Tax=Metallococcus carri TaxID=1656884 RepID=A0A967E8Y2_9MICO|nr:thioredoxin domain-containing protein [Metallococcus carri]NHN54289.1 thioredoxin domain-containing protein [Metallococcus carri]NOP36871.1 thioredoxin domain-containing protein [Calidifontibacter sp. DB2511S]
MPRPDASAKLAQAKPKDRSGLRNAIIAAIAVIAVVGIVVAIFATRGSGNTAADGPKGSNPGGKGVVAYPGKAAEGAPVVDLYEDFQCPICKQLETTNGSAIDAAAKAGKIKLVYHMMSFLDDNLRNDGSKIAANASFCASDAGKFPQFHKAAFAAQRPEEQAQQGDTFSVNEVKGYASKMGLSGSALTTYQQCVSSDKYSKYVTATQTQSSKDGVNGTPTLKINGQALDQNQMGGLLNDPGSFDGILAQYAK